MSWFEVTAGCASILGLLASLLAFYQAKSAAKAAGEARNATLSKTIADELQDASGRAEELVDFIQHERFAEADLRARDLLSLLAEVPHRRNKYLDKDSRDDLQQAGAQLQVLTDALTDKTKASADRLRLVSVTRKYVVVKLKAALGRARTRVD